MGSGGVVSTCSLYLLLFINGAHSAQLELGRRGAKVCSVPNKHKQQVRAKLRLTHASTKSCGSLMGRAVAHAFSKSVNVRLLERLSWRVALRACFRSAILEGKF